jgi:hypothetical protein
VISLCQCRNYVTGRRQITKTKERLLNLKEISVKRIRRRFRDAIYDELSYLNKAVFSKVSVN